MEGVADKLHAAAPKAFVEIGYRFTRHTTDLRAQLCVHTLNMLLGLYGHEGGVLQNRFAKLSGLPVEFPKPDMSKSILKWKIDNEPERWLASPLPVHLEPRWMLQKPRLGPDEFVPATGFTPLSSFTGAQARDNPILVALHHRMRYANVFINEARARRLGLKEGDLVEVWMEEHPDEKQQAFLSVSKVIHQDVLFSYHGLGKGLQKTTEKLQYAKKNGLNLNHFGRLRLSPGVCGHTPQDIVLKIRKVG